MRMVGVTVMIMGVIMMLFFSTFIFGTVFDNIALATAGGAIFGKPDWIALALKRFELMSVAAIGISAAMIIWGFINAIKTADYSREF
jgi:hypothetical protein